MAETTAEVESEAVVVVKHGGCSDCQTREVPVLRSTPVPGQVMSKAVCPACARKYGMEG